MARGRWLRRGEQSEQGSGLFGSNQDACCVQAFTKSARFTDAASFHLFAPPVNAGNTINPPHSYLTGAEGGSLGSGGSLDGKSKGANNARNEGDNDPRGGGVSILNTRIGGGNERRRARGAAAPPADSGLPGPVFYRAAWRRTGEKMAVWKISSRWVYWDLCCSYAQTVKQGRWLATKHVHMQ